MAINSATSSSKAKGKGVDSTDFSKTVIYRNSKEQKYIPIISKIKLSKISYPKTTACFTKTQYFGEHLILN